MKISTKGQYALRMMVDLAINNSGEYLTIKSVAARQGLPEKYLEQITTMLSRAGYLKSVRGSKGGYRLADKPEKYTVGMILRTTEGSLSPVSCLEEEPDYCPQSRDCVTFDVWKQLNDAINQIVDHITLEDLVKKHQDKIGNDYVI